MAVAVFVLAIGKAALGANGTVLEFERTGAQSGEKVYLVGNPVYTSSSGNKMSFSTLTNSIGRGLSFTFAGDTLARGPGNRIELDASVSGSPPTANSTVTSGLMVSANYVDNSPSYGVVNTSPLYVWGWYAVVSDSASCPAANGSWDGAYELGPNNSAMDIACGTGQKLCVVASSNQNEMATTPAEAPPYQLTPASVICSSRGRK